MNPNIYISSNIENGGPATFKKNIINYLKKVDNLNVTYSYLNCDLAILIGENYKFKELIYLIINKKKLICRLDGRRFNFFSGTKIKRYGKKNIYQFFKSIYCETKVIFAYLISHGVIYQSIYTRKQWILLEKLLKKNFTIILNPSPLTFEKKYSTNINNDLLKKRLENKYIVISKGYLQDSIFLENLYEVCCASKIRIFLFSNFDSKQEKKYPLIEFFGFLEYKEYIRYLNNSFAFVSIEDYCCCPNSLIEAQNLGIPIIGPNNGSLPEMCPFPRTQLIDDGNNQKKELYTIIKSFSDHYEYWANSSLTFSSKSFGLMQYKKYKRFILKIF